MPTALQGRTHLQRIDECWAQAVVLSTMPQVPGAATCETCRTYDM